MEPRHPLHGDLCRPSHSPQEKPPAPRLPFLSFPQLTGFLTLVRRQQRPLAGGLAMGHELVLVGLRGLFLPLMCNGETMNFLCKDGSLEISWV